MKTKELAELAALSTLVESANIRVIDGRRILTVSNGTCYCFDKIEQRAIELLLKLLEPYKIKSENLQHAKRGRWERLKYAILKK